MVIGLASQEADFAFGLMPPFRPFIEDKRIRVLAVADEKRNELYPEIPTFKELGFNVIIPAFEALHTPKGLPEPVLKKLSAAAEKALTDPDLKARFASVGLNLSYQPGPELTAWLKTYDEETKALMTDLGLNVNH